MSKPSDSAYAPPERGPLDALFGTLIRVTKRITELDLSCAYPGVVKRVTAGQQGVRPATVDVLPSRKIAVLKPDGTEDLQDPKVIHGCVVGQLCVPGAFKITLPIRVGTQGWLFFADRSLEGWWDSNGDPTDPVFGHCHNPNDALFVPWGASAGAALTFDTSDLVISTDTGAAQEPGEIRMDAAGNVTVEGPTINLGRNGTPGTDAVALAQLVHQYLTQLIAAAAPAPMDGGAGMKATMTAFLSANPFTAMAANNLNGRRS